MRRAGTEGWGNFQIRHRYNWCSCAIGAGPPVLTSVQKEEKTVVTGRVAGNIPGSPIDLQFVVSVEAGKIASLEIH